MRDWFGGALWKALFVSALSANGCVHAGAPERVDPLSVHGIVVDASDTPVPGVWIVVDDRDVAVTGEDGRWSARLDDPDRKELVRPPGAVFSQTERSGLRTGGEPNRWRLGGVRLVMARGEGVLREGEIVRTLAVQGPGLEPPRNPRRFAQATRPTTQQVDARGNVPVHADAGDVDHYVMPFRKDGVRVIVVREDGTVLVSDPELREDAARNGARVSPAPTIRIDGVVHAAPGGAVAGADVEYQPSTRLEWPGVYHDALHWLPKVTARTDASGRFSMRVLRVESAQDPAAVTAIAPDGRRGRTTIAPSADRTDVGIVVE